VNNCSVNSNEIDKKDEQLINLAQLKIIIKNIHSKVEKAEAEYFSASGYIRISLAKKIKKLKNKESKIVQEYDLLKSLYNYI